MINFNKKGLNIAILLPSYDQSESCFKELDPSCDPSIFDKNKENKYEKFQIHKATSFKQICELAQSKKFDLFINLCDGAYDEDRAGEEVIHALETFNLPYTGANAVFYNYKKEYMKMVAHTSGVQTPAHAFIFDIEELSDLELNFPMIVKHYNGYSSIGLTGDSKVTNFDQLKIQTEKMIKEYGGALIEEFIDGREFTVLVAENPKDRNNPISFQPFECVFGGGESFKYFDLKWINYDNIKWEPVRDEQLSEKLKLMSKQIFLAMDGNSYGRVDIRMNNREELYFLEMNPNCGIFYPTVEVYGSADFILAHDPIGHDGFLNLIIESAFKAHQARQKKYTIFYSKSMGYGLKANQNIEIGEVIEIYEEKDHALVSQQQVKNWDQIKQKWFKQYAYPVSDGVFAMWSDDPKRWKPINHSCEPNSWLEGLNLVARKNITKGELITLEYATFCADTLESFECGCNSSNCRKIIRATDYLEPFVEEIYKDHISDYVKCKRLASIQQVRSE